MAEVFRHLLRVVCLESFKGFQQGIDLLSLCLHLSRVETDFGKRCQSVQVVLNAVLVLQHRFGRDGHEVRLLLPDFLARLSHICKELLGSDGHEARLLLPDFIGRLFHSCQKLLFDCFSSICLVSSRSHGRCRFHNPVGCQLHAGFSNPLAKVGKGFSNIRRAVRLLVVVQCFEQVVHLHMVGLQEVSFLQTEAKATKPAEEVILAVALQQEENAAYRSSIEVQRHVHMLVHNVGNDGVGLVFQGVEGGLAVAVRDGNIETARVVLFVLVRKLLANGVNLREGDNIFCQPKLGEVVGAVSAVGHVPQKVAGVVDFEAAKLLECVRDSLAVFIVYEPTELVPKVELGAISSDDSSHFFDPPKNLM